MGPRPCEHGHDFANQATARFRIMLQWGSTDTTFTAWPGTIPFTSASFRMSISFSMPGAIRQAPWPAGPALVMLQRRESLPPFILDRSGFGKQELHVQGRTRFKAAERNSKPSAEFPDVRALTGCFESALLRTFQRCTCIGLMEPSQARPRLPEKHPRRNLKRLGCAAIRFSGASQGPKTHINRNQSLPL
jgi:hypothetical protein